MIDEEVVADLTVSVDFTKSIHNGQTVVTNDAQRSSAL